VDDRPDVVLRAVFPDPEDHYGSRWRMFRPHIAAMFQARDAKRLAENTQTQLRGRIRPCGQSSARAVLATVAPGTKLGETWRDFDSVAEAAAAAKAEGVLSAYDESLRAFEVPVRDRDVAQVISLIDKINQKAKGKGMGSVAIDATEDTVIAYTLRDEIWPTRFIGKNIKMLVPILKFAGWSFLAQIQHPGGLADNLINTMSTDLDASLWREAPARCEHCNTSRRRSNTYLVRHDNGEIKQVGQQCLKEYTGIDPANAVLAFSIWKEIAELERTADDGGLGDPEFDEREGRGRATHLSALGIMAIGAMLLRAGLGRDKDAFWDEYGAFLAMKEKGQKTQTDVSEADRAVAREALLALRKKAHRGDSSYIMNLQALLWSSRMQKMLHGVPDAELETFDADVPVRNERLILSWVRVRSMEIAREAQARADAEAAPAVQGPPHVGKVGERQRNLPASIFYSSAQTGDYGTTFFHMAKLATGQVVSFKNKDDYWINGQPTDVVLTGTVKDHRTDKRGRPITSLSRTVVEMPKGVDDPYRDNAEKGLADLLFAAHQYRVGKYTTDANGAPSSVTAHAAKVEGRDIPPGLKHTSLSQVETALRKESFVLQSQQRNKSTWGFAEDEGGFARIEQITIDDEGTPVFIAVERGPTHTYKADPSAWSDLQAMVAATKAARS
jgi:hypothetical protein